MRYFCRECGREIEPGADFCYYCGALKSKAIAIDDSGRVVDQSAAANGVCPVCGHQNVEGAKFCSQCGQQLSQPSENAGDINGMYTPYTYTPKKLSGREYLALFLAFVPGMFLFGIGHLAIKKYSRAFMYLAIAAVMIYLYATVISSGNGSSTLGLLFFFVQFFIYFKQAMEVIQEIYKPEDDKGKGSGPGEQGGQ